MTDSEQQLTEIVEMLRSYDSDRDLDRHIEAFGAGEALGDPLRTTRVERPDWDEYFLGIAEAVSRRAECARRQHGAVIVDRYNRVISTGYNGTPPGDERSCFRGDCPRASSDAPANSGGYENCIALHAEQNAIANATRDTRGGIIYITGPPCPMCAKLVLAAGLEPRFACPVEKLASEVDNPVHAEDVQGD